MTPLTWTCDKTNEVVEKYKRIIDDGDSRQDRRMTTMTLFLNHVIDPVKIPEEIILEVHNSRHHSWYYTRQITVINLFRSATERGLSFLAEDSPRCIDRVQVVIVDAKPFDDYQSQLSAAAMRRELTKFYCGMVKPANGQRDVRGVATGHWGCGVFGGDKRLKAVIQLMAAAQAGRLPVVYCVFGDKELEKELLGLARTITKTRCTVKDLWNAVAEFADRMERFGPRGDDERGLYPFIERHCRAVARSNL